MKKIFSFLIFIDFIYSTKANYKRRYQDETTILQEQNSTVDLKKSLDNDLIDSVLKDLEQYEDNQNGQKRAKYSEYHFDYEDFSEFLDSIDVQKPIQDESAGRFIGPEAEKMAIPECNFDYEDFSEFLDSMDFQKLIQNESTESQTECMDLVDFIINDNLTNDQFLTKQSDVSEQDIDFFIGEPKQVSNKKRMDMKAENDFNSQHNFSLVVELSNDENIDEHLNTSSANNNEMIDCSNELLKGLKKNILNFITKNIPTSYRNMHIKRMEDLERDLVIVSKYKLDSTLYFYIYDPIYDKQLLDKLKKLNIDKFLNFNQEKYNQVSDIIFTDILMSKEAKVIRSKFDNLPDDYKKIIFYFELFKIYKYATNISELLTLNKLLQEIFFSRITFLIHIMNLAVRLVDKIENIRVFILCIILMAYKNSYRFEFDIFGIQKYYVPCNKTVHNLYFFTWEYQNAKRHFIKSRNLENLYVHHEDKFSVKTVFLTYLYQHMLYLKYLNFSYENIINFQDFSLKVIESEDCIGCLFDEFLRKIING